MKFFESFAYPVAGCSLFTLRSRQAERKRIYGKFVLRCPVLSRTEPRFIPNVFGFWNWISELIWREFYRHILTGFPRVCKHRPFKPETDKLPWRQEHKQFEAWCAGRTGFPLVDAGMRQLVQTGWMHNRVRMVDAMFLTKDLFIDWRWGERYFMQNLVDGDFASNNGGWQWSASTGTDAAPYFRIFNPFSQSSRYDPDGSFICCFVPELSGLRAPRIHRPHEPSSVDLDYPRPIVDRKETRQLVMHAFRRLSKKSRAARKV